MQRFVPLYACIIAAVACSVTVAAVSCGPRREPVQYRLRQIMIEPAPSETRIAAIRARAGDCLARARSGEDFGALARTLSEEPGADRTGGDLGWFTFDRMVRPFSEAVFAMKPGEIRGPVQTQFGFHIIELLGVRGDERQARHILFALTPGPEDSLAARERLAAARRELLDGAAFEDVLRRYCNNDLILSTGGYMVWQRPDEMLDSFRQAAAGLGREDVSEPFASILGMHIVVVDSINHNPDHLLEGLPPHIAARPAGN